MASAYILGTPKANAKLIRNLNASLASLSLNLTEPCLTNLEICCKQNAFSTLSKEGTKLLIPTLLKLVLSDSEDIRALSLRIFVYLIQAAPSTAVNEHWLSLFQRISQVIKSSSVTCNPILHSQTLVTIASLLSSAVVKKIHGGPQKALLSTCCQSALVHATRVVYDNKANTKVAGAAFAVIFAILRVAPREVRSSLNKIEEHIWNIWLNHHDTIVRELVAELHSNLIICYSDKLKQQAFHDRIRNVSEEMKDIMNIVDQFTSFSRSHLEVENEALKSLSVAQLAVRFETMCNLLQTQVRCQYKTRMPFPLALVVKTLTHGINQREINPYAKDQSDLQINADTAMILVSSVFLSCSQVLSTVAITCHSALLLPFASTIGNSISTRMTDIYLRCEQDLEIISSCAERKMLYKCLTVLIRTLGMSIIMRTISSFTRLFSFDVDQTRKIFKFERLCELDGGSDLSDRRKLKKRRRSRDQSHDPKTENDTFMSKEAEQLLDSNGGVICEEGKKTLAAGLDVCSAIFDNREFLNDALVQDMNKLEEVLRLTMSPQFVELNLLKATTSASVSGGSGRAKGEAGQLFLQNTLLSTKLLTSPRYPNHIRETAFVARSASETVIHPSGPPSWHSTRKYIQDSAPGLSHNHQRKKRVRFNLLQSSPTKEISDKENNQARITGDTTTQDVNDTSDKMAIDQGSTNSTDMNKEKTTDVTGEDEKERIKTVPDKTGHDLNGKSHEANGNDVIDSFKEIESEITPVIMVAKANAVTDLPRQTVPQQREDKDKKALKFSYTTKRSKDLETNPCETPPSAQNTNMQILKVNERNKQKLQDQVQATKEVITVPNAAETGEAEKETLEDEQELIDSLCFE